MVKWIAIVLVIAVVFMVTVLYTKPEAFCASVWRYGTVADDDGRAAALRAIAAAEHVATANPALISSQRLSESGREVVELWSAQVGDRTLKYEITFFYVPGGPFCGPRFRSATAHGK